MHQNRHCICSFLSINSRCLRNWCFLSHFVILYWIIDPSSALEKINVEEQRNIRENESNLGRLYPASCLQWETDKLFKSFNAMIFLTASFFLLIMMSIYICGFLGNFFFISEKWYLFILNNYLLLSIIKWIYKLDINRN